MVEALDMRPHMRDLVANYALGAAHEAGVSSSGSQRTKAQGSVIVLADGQTCSAGSGVT